MALKLSTGPSGEMTEPKSNYTIVDFPDPEGPIIAVEVPAFIENFISEIIKTLLEKVYRRDHFKVIKKEQ